jgi:LmbE family N-acetylglucosaminyl deacetylase
MKIFNSRKTKISLASLFATLTIATINFSFPTESASIHQDPTVTSKQIEALPRSTSTANDRVELYQALLDLQNPWTVMCVAAHPDDEDGTSLIVMRRKFGAHTVSLFSTFGEGGQNAIGPELYEELGAIRARETMAAAEIQGSEPHFLGLKDFGYSKTRDEAFKFWGHEEGLRRMVLEIRRLRPDVTITNHSTTSNDHGQHQATALMVVEAFDAAADPNRFPEQLKDGVTTWQVQRLFVRARGNQTQNSDAQIVTIDPNEKDPVRGVVYAEEALRALQQHATQGPWPKSFAEYATRFRAFSGQPGGAPGQLPPIRYRLVREAKGAVPLPSNSTSFADGLKVPDNVAKLQLPTIEGKPLIEFAAQPDRVFDALAAAIRSGTFRPENLHLANRPDDSHLKWISERTGAALALAGGITATLSSQSGVVVRGTRAAFTLKIVNKGSRPAQIVRAPFYGLTTGSILKPKPNLNPGETTEVEAADQIVPDEKITVPHSTHLYDGGYAGRPERGSLLVEIANKTFEVPYKLSVDVAPAVEISSINPSPLVVRPDEVGVSSAGADVFPTKLPDLKIELINYLDQRFDGEVVFGQNNQPAQSRRKVQLLPHQIATLALPMPSPAKTAAAHTRFSSAAEALSVSVRSIGSGEDITTREVPIVRANARVARNLRIGYVRGFDFSLPNALTALGVESKELTVDDVKTADLQKYTSIIVDNRVYESQPDLIAANQKLLDYANAGGTLIVFYHKSNEWNPDERRKRPQLAPYKLILGDERITDETAPITFLEPDHPLLNSPNKMGPDDFKDWVQERGLYYPKEWDSQYHALLQSNDPGETPLKGGLLVADYARGHYIYTSMVWYRELRGGIPGAYRMLANMISYGHSK